VTIALLLDSLLIGLLAATLVYAVVLNRRLGALRKERKTFENTLSNFNSATQLAAENIHRLKAVADVSSKALQKQTHLAGVLCDDLAFLADRGETAADRLDHSIRAVGNAHKTGKAGRVKIASPARPVPSRSPQKSVAEHELIEALQSVR